MAQIPPSPSPNGQWKDFFVLCLFDFQPTDPDHQPFEKNDILEIVRVEDTGWWAALVDEKVGWVPKAYVQPLSDVMAMKLKGLRPEDREAYLAASRSPMPTPSTLDVWADLDRANIASPNTLTTTRAFPADVTPGYNAMTIPISPVRPTAISDVLDDYFDEESPADPNSVFSRSQGDPPPPEYADYLQSPTTPYQVPRSPIHAAPQVPIVTTTPAAFYNKPTPPTPTADPDDDIIDPPARSQSMRRPEEEHYPLNRRSNSASAAAKRPPFPVSTTRDPNRLSTFVDHDVPTHKSRSSSRSSSFSGGAINAHASLPRNPAASRQRSDPPSLGSVSAPAAPDGDAYAFRNAKNAQDALPWYLQATHGPPELKLDQDGAVLAGTVSALVERLTIDPLKLIQDTTYRRAFLSTFKTFSTADEVFDLLIARFKMEPPAGLTEAEIQEWRDKKLKSTQSRVLSIFSNWLEDYGMPQDDPQLTIRLRDFLQTVQTPHNIALTARLMVQSIDRLPTSPQPEPAVSPNAKRKGKPPKPLKLDLLKMDPYEIATQITILESRAYSRIRLSDCIALTRTRAGTTPNLSAFSNSEKVSDWVQMSILANEGLGKRADTIDFWIKVAEHCRSLNNMSCLFAVVGGLSTLNVGVLHLTWQHVTRRPQLEALAKICDPANAFAAYRTLFYSTDTPGVPFLGMLSADLVHLNSQLKDNVANEGLTLINFAKRQKISDVIQALLKFKAKPMTGFDENQQMAQYVDNQLQIAAGKDQGTFWARSQELQAAEVAHADIRKGLVAAGF